MESLGLAKLSSADAGDEEELGGAQDLKSEQRGWSGCSMGFFTCQVA